MNKNDIVEIQITGMTDEGSGVGRHNNIAVFVPFALVNEIVRVLIIKVNKTYCIGKLLEVLKPSPCRIKSDCEYFYRCGGCSFRNVAYSEELSYKFGFVKDCMERIGKIDAPILPVLGGERTLYRNKAQFPVYKNEAGLYAKHSHRVIDIEDCAIQNEESVKILNAVRDFMRENGILGYDEEKHSGIIRNVYTRTGGGKTLVCIVTLTEDLPHASVLVEKIQKTGVPLWGILQNINSKRTNVVLGKEMKTLFGQSFMRGNIGEFTFKISPFSFFQVNPEQTKVLYDTVKNFLGETSDKIIWDLYCGIGTIGQYAASDAKKLIGIEIVPEAVKNAEENAKINGISNCEYYEGAAEALAPRLLRSGKKPYAVILDPPRKGCDKKLLDTVAKVAPQKIIYVSCKASTLARDLAHLEEKGYKTEIIRPVDMFPGTPHIECCALICRK